MIRIIMDLGRHEIPTITPILSERWVKRTIKQIARMPGAHMVKAKL